jgi:hypothetical protein
MVPVILFILTLSRSAFSQTNYDISNLELLLKADLPTIQKIAQDLINSYNPEKFLYVTIGSSPAPLQAYLAVTMPHIEVINVPLTGLNKGYQYESLQVLESKLIQKRFLEFLEDKVQQSGKGLVLIDYVSTGRTLRRALEAAQNAFPHLQVVPYGMFAYEQSLERWQQDGRKGIVVGHEGFGGHLNKSDYGVWAEYESIDIRENKIVDNSWYGALLKTMGTVSGTPYRALTCSHLFSKN